MAPKISPVINPMLTPPMNLDHTPLADRNYKIAKRQCDFDLFELHFWFQDNFLDQSDEIQLWQSILPLFVVPQSYHFPEFFLRSQASYLASKRAIIFPNGEILFTIIANSINQMPQVPHCDSLSPFSLKALR